MLATGQHHPANRDLVHFANGLADHRKGVVTDLAVGTQIIWPDQVARIDLGFLDKLVDLDSPRRFQRELIELLLADLNEGFLIERVPLDDVFVRHFLASIGIDLHISDAVAGLLVELVKRDLLAI